MSTTQILTPTSRLRFGLARTDITPPAGIYHPLWGAARHHRATGIHRPLKAEVMAFAPAGTGQNGVQLIRAQLDLPGLVKSQHQALLETLSQAGGLPVDQIVISYSHTHAAGWFAPDRFELPGGELIEPYLRDVSASLSDVCRQALADLQEAVITYGQGRCTLAANRDYWDEANGIYACGYNPDAPADDTLIVGRITNAANQLIAVVINYGCHPTTLAWENTLVSPDYIGAMREIVEQVTGAVPVFAQGACGDLGPKEGFVGDVAVADRNGRQLAYAALAILESMPPQPAVDFHYQGPVISGATLGTWAYRPFTEARLAETARFGGGVYSVDLPLKAKPDLAALRRELEDLLAKVKDADARGDAIAARDYNAHAERARRWLARLKDLPDSPTMPLAYSVHRLGDALWITTGGEPYNAIQVELRRRFPTFTLLFSPLASELQVAYLLPADRYGQGLYQEEPSILAPGCLEMLTEAIAVRIDDLIS
jgi:hypothetical protein